MTEGTDRERSSHTDADPVLITEAEPSYEEQFRQRRRKYLVMMSMRVPLLVAAGLTYDIWWLALGLVVLSVPLPWMAVLVANDRPPRKSESVNRFRGEQRQRSLERGQHQVIER